MLSPADETQLLAACALASITPLMTDFDCSRDDGSLLFRTYTCSECLSCSAEFKSLFSLALAAASTELLSLRRFF